MLCSAAPEKVSALNLKRLKADNKACGQPHQILRDAPQGGAPYLFGGKI